MAQSNHILDRELSKFVESSTRPGSSAVEITGSLSGTFSTPANCYCYTYSTGTDSGYYTEVYRFYESGTPASPVNLIKTVTLYYNDSLLTDEVGGSVS